MQDGIFMAMEIHVVVLWAMTLYNDVVGYHCFTGPHCLSLQGEVNGRRYRYRWRQHCLLEH